MGAQGSRGRFAAVTGKDPPYIQGGPDGGFLWVFLPDVCAIWQKDDGVFLGRLL